MDSQIRTGRIAGVWFILTFVVSIPAVVLYEPLFKHTDYILSAGVDNRIFLGALSEIFLVIANIATAVVFFPMLNDKTRVSHLGMLPVV